MRQCIAAVSAAAIALSAVIVPVWAGQDALSIDTAITGPVLKFDWPAVEIGTATYEAGPTGVTVIRFPQRAVAAVDVRGGSPGTYDTDTLRLGYQRKRLDAVVFAGGSAYGLEAIAGVETGLKDDGERSGENIASVTGAIIYDFLGHRLNEIYPDKRLGQAALHAVRPGIFPLGAQGAGRMAMQGSFLGAARTPARVPRSGRSVKRRSRPLSSSTPMAASPIATAISSAAIRRRAGASSRISRNCSPICPRAMAAIGRHRPREPGAIRRSAWSSRTGRWNGSR